MAGVPAGTGVMIMANRQVEVFDNKIENNQNVSLSIISYLVTQQPVRAGSRLRSVLRGDLRPRQQVRRRRRQAERQAAAARSAILTGEGKLPDIVYDGVVDEKKAVDGKLPEKLAIRIRNNGDADFMNFDFADLDLSNPLAMDKKRDKVSRDLKPYEGEMPKLQSGEDRRSELMIVAAVRRRVAFARSPRTAVGRSRSASACVAAGGVRLVGLRSERAGPQKLSEYGLFVGNGSYARAGARA